MEEATSASVEPATLPETTAGSAEINPDEEDVDANGRKLLPAARRIAVVGLLLFLNFGGFLIFATHYFSST